MADQARNEIKTCLNTYYIKLLISLSQDTVLTKCYLSHLLALKKQV